MVAAALVLAFAGGSISESTTVRAFGAVQARAQATGTAQDPQAPAQPPRAGGPGRRGGASELPNPDSMTPQQVEGMFDAYVVAEARRVLRMTDEQFLTVGARINRLQMLRRQLQRERQGHVRTLRGMLAPNAAFDDNAAAASVKALDDIVAQSGEQIRQAYAEIDRLLTPRQRAQFRVLEDNMERMKLDMLARARERARTPGR